MASINSVKRFTFLNLGPMVGYFVQCHLFATTGFFRKGAGSAVDTTPDDKLAANYLASIKLGPFAFGYVLVSPRPNVAVSMINVIQLKGD